MFNYDEVKAIGRQLLTAIGEDPDRPGLKDTPRRFADMWREFIEYKPGNIAVTFEEKSIDQMVVVSGIEAWSLCEHHLLPFRVEITIGYIPMWKVIGLSKFARIVQKHAHKLQLQERLTEAIATEVSDIAGCPNVAVIGKGQHLCMTMRGIKTPANMHTDVMWGLFRSDPATRAEFLSIISAR